MSEAVKTRSLVLRPHEARRLAERGSALVVRVVSPQPHSSCSEGGCGWHWHSRGRDDHYVFITDESKIGDALVNSADCPFGRVGDEFWCREAYYDRGDYATIGKHRKDRYVYAADATHGGWILHKAVHMPRDASRFTVVVEGVQCKPIRGVTEEEAIATGIERDGEGRWKHYCKPKFGPSPIHSFETLQRKLYGPDAWASNVHCWFATMRRIEL